jgi:hypothetical protein
VITRKAIVAWILLLNVTAIVSLAQNPQQAVPEAAAQELDQAISDLSKSYRLEPGESLRVIDPPFSAERSAVIRLNYGVSQEQSKQVAAVVFAWRGGKCIPIAWTYHAPTLEFLLQTIDGTWIDRQSLAAVKWTPVPMDVVVNEKALPAQKLAAMSEVISRRVGKKVRLSYQPRLRPTIVLSGGTEHPGSAYVDAERRGGFAVFVTAQNLDEKLARMSKQLTLYGRMGRPDDTRWCDRDGFAANIGAPFVRDGQGDGQFWRTDAFLVFDDVALWKPTDAGYEGKVKRVLANLKKQLGGDWRLEPRQIEMLTLEVEGKGKTP